MSGESEAYERRLRLTSSDVDMYRRLRPGVLAGLLQETAIAHTEALGVGRDRTLDRGLLWVVTRLHGRVRRLPEYGQEVLLRTWPGEMLHVLFPRYYRLTDAAGQELLWASSLWLLMDRETRAMTSPQRHGIRIDGCPPVEGLPLPDRSPLFPPEPYQQQRRAVRYSEADLNGHMNNTRYFDWAEDLSEADWHRQHPLRGFWVEYRGELRCGDEVLLRSQRAGDSLWLRGQTGQREAFRLCLDYGQPPAE